MVVVQLPSGDYGLLQHGLLRCGLPRIDSSGERRKLDTSTVMACAGFVFGGDALGPC